MQKRRRWGRIIGLTLLAAFVLAYAGLWIHTKYFTPVATFDIIRQEWPLYPKVTTSLGHSCEAPCAIEIWQSEPFQLTLSYPGFHDHKQIVRPLDWTSNPGKVQMEPLR